MAFVPGVTYDVFISYAHVDNLEGWVDAFHRQLAVKLTSRVGRAGWLRIWRDEALDGSQLFDDVIRRRIEGSAVFLALCSPGFLRSDYCRRELAWFREHAGETLTVGERTRLVNVQLYNVPRKEWPDEFGRASGFGFHDAEDAEDFGDPLEPTCPAFRQRTLELRDAVYRILEELTRGTGGGEEGAADGGPAASPDPSVVYLAGVSDGLRVLHDRLAADLGERGIEVAGRIPPPYDADHHDEAVRRGLDRASLAVHLFDALGGSPVEGEEAATYPRRQFELGRESGVPQLVWVPRGLDLSSVEDPAQREFLERLEGGERDEAAYEFVRGLPNAVGQAVAGRLERLVAEAAPATQPAVLLDTHVKDQLAAIQASQAFLEHNVQPFVNPEEDDPRSNMTILEERLKRVQALVVFFGQASEQWVRTRLVEAIKLAITVGCNLRACGVFLAPPEAGKSEAAFELPLVRVHLLDNRGGFDPRTLDPIFQGLGLK